MFRYKSILATFIISIFLLTCTKQNNYDVSRNNLIQFTTEITDILTHTDLTDSENINQIINKLDKISIKYGFKDWTDAQTKISNQLQTFKDSPSIYIDEKLLYELIQLKK